MVQHKAMTAGHCMENRMCSVLLLGSVVHYFLNFLSWLYVISAAYSILWPALLFFFFKLKSFIFRHTLRSGLEVRHLLPHVMFQEWVHFAHFRCHMENRQTWVIPGTMKQTCSRYMPGWDFISSTILLKSHLGKWKQCHKEKPLWNYILWLR